MADVMSAMPDMYQRALVDHGPDEHGRCQTCRNDGVSAVWPCATYQVAQQAKQIHQGGADTAEAALPTSTAEPRTGGRHAAD